MVVVVVVVVVVIVAVAAVVAVVVSSRGDGGGCGGGCGDGGCGGVVIILVITVNFRFKGRSLPLRFAYFRNTCNTCAWVIRKTMRKLQHGNTRLVLSISRTSVVN